MIIETRYVVVLTELKNCRFSPIGICELYLKIQILESFVLLPCGTRRRAGVYECSNEYENGHIFMHVTNGLLPVGYYPIDRSAVFHAVLVAIRVFKHPIPTPV